MVNFPNSTTKRVLKDVKKPGKGYKYIELSANTQQMDALIDVATDANIGNEACADPKLLCNNDAHTNVTRTTRGSTKDMNNTVVSPPQPIINAVLTFAVFGMSSSTFDKNLKVIMSSFSDAEIIDAKNILFNTCGKQLDRLIVRADSIQRTAKMANTQDILMSLTKLDRINAVPLFVVDAMGLCRIPRINPEEIHEVAIAEKLAMLEAKVNMLDQAVAVNTNNHIIMKQQMSRSSEQLVTSINQPVNKHNDKQGTTYAASLKAKPTPRIIAHGGARPKETIVPTTHIINNANVRGGVASSSQQVGQSTASSSIQNDEGFGIQRNQRRKEKRLTIRGTATNCTVKGAPEPIRELFISRVDNSTTTNVLKQHLHNNNINVIDLSQLSNELSKFKSFKLTVPRSLFASLFDGNLWPSGVNVRKYIPPRSNNVVIS
jgi:hypothetical protein